MSRPCGPSNIALERSGGSHSLAPAAHRSRYAAQPVSHEWWPTISKPLSGPALSGNMLYRLADQ
jgi:hypothetical protein